jgi:hypothetical protein
MALNPLIRATTSWQGDAASATILQTNAAPAVKSARSKWIIAAVVAGGAAGFRPSPRHH